jgi:hypothetical protein
MAMGDFDLIIMKGYFTSENITEDHYAHKGFFMALF